MNFLAVQISNDTARLSYIVSSKCKKTWDITFDDQIAYRYKEYLNDFFLNEGIFKLNIDECVVAWSSFKSSIVPVSLFTESTPKDIYKTTFGNEIKKSEIDFNRIPNLNIVNVFFNPLWLKSFFVLKFPSVIIKHEGTHLIRYLSSTAKNDSKLKIVLSISDSYFFFIVFQGLSLKAYLINDYNHEDDIIYHIGFASNQLGINQEKGGIDIVSNSKISDDKINAIKQKIAKLNLFPELEIDTESNLIFKALHLCV